jgi:hypothetical protein
MKNYPQTKILGAQIDNLGDATITQLASDSGIYWARIDAFNWAKIEPQNTDPGNYNWDVIDEQSLQAANENNMRVIAIIRKTPSWAQKIPPYVCGPIAQSALPDFADFVTELVKRYGSPPYNIKYWELGNEPDVDPNLVSPNSAFGCWGNINETYYGGEYYAEMLKEVYPAIKSVDPDAKVLIGGLLLNCDPTEYNKCQEGRFLEGIFRNGGGDYFDAVSYHGYTPYSGSSSGVGALHFDENFPKWEHRGGVVLGKLDYLRSLMVTFGAYKPVFLTEGSLICPEYMPTDCDPPTSGFYESQADYVVWLYVRNWASGIKGTIWYQFEGPGWRYGGLLDENQVPKPAYNALEFLYQELGNATYNGHVDLSIVVYEFMTDLKKIWVLWSPDENPHNITLPNNTLKVLDKYGNEIQVDGNQIIVNKPIYIELNK